MVVIRIHTVESGAMDWHVDAPEGLTFDYILMAMSQAEPTLLVQAFEYNDEDDEKITVRTDEELKTMFYCLLTEDPSCIIELWPKGIRKTEQRNIHGLKIETKDDGSPLTRELAESQKKKHSGDIEEILQSGSIHEADLEYLQILGSGSAGTVYKALHKPSKKSIAVKVIRLDINAHTQKQIISELDILHKCHSSTIIEFYGAFFKENRIFIAAEFMDGGSLDHYGQIPEPILGRIAVTVAKGLQYLWSLKIMHRDVKPSNILVNTQGVVKLCDFGVSVQLINSIASTYIGTNAYMAPERIQGLEYSIQADVWSFGISLYELATAVFPFESAKNKFVLPVDLFKSILGTDTPKLPQGIFLQPFVDFVAQCMSKDPRKRPAPEALMEYPFIQAYNDGNTAVIAQWVTTANISKQ